MQRFFILIVLMLRKRENWTSQLGVVLAVTGSAVGLGNFLRFPGQAALYGGGSYMIAYLIAFAIIGVPLAWVEWGIGRYGGLQGYNSPPGILRKFLKSDVGAYFGVFGVLLPTIIFMYYVVIEAWCLQYAFEFIFQPAHAGGVDSYKIHFENMSGQNQPNGYLLRNGIFNVTLLCLFACLCLNFYLLYHGITKGIEKFCNWALPLLFICSIVITIRVLTLPTEIDGQGIIEGLGFIWNPAQPTVYSPVDGRVIIEGKTFIQGLSNSQTWLAAAGHVFFAMSIGMGAVMTYTSYTRRSDDIISSCGASCAANGFCECVIAALMVVPAAYVFLGPAFLSPETLKSSFAIGFYTLPHVFDQMPFGRFFGFLFFGLMFLAAVTSSISLIQPFIVLLEEGLRLSKSGGVAVVAVVCGVGSLFVFYFSNDMKALDTFDFMIANLLVLVLALFQAIAFGWWFGIDKGIAELERGSRMKIPFVIKFTIKYITPAYLLIIYIAWCFQSLPEYATKICNDSVRMLSVLVIVAVFVLVYVITAISIRQWRKEEAEQLENENVYRSR
ncbi:MAG: sodium:calcium symporter [Planctomycetaceae bacterium]|nr:sodium:calcium symporter [Planctomycetaceae bacterium]